MPFSSCFRHSSFSFKIHHPSQDFRRPCCNITSDSRSTFASKRLSTATSPVNWCFLAGSRVNVKPRFTRENLLHRRISLVNASWLVNSQIASGVFTFSTIAVLPFYTLMIAAPKADLTKKWMESSIPYVVLGILYAYLLYLSWTPETIKLMFASKYWLPELPGIARMFSNEMTLASAWIHLLAVDLFAARQVFQDGLKNKIETRHSVSLCLLFCPVGIFIHFITKAFTRRAARKNGHI